MIIYSVNVILNPEVQFEWFKYMKEEHIPAVMKAGYFNNFSLRQLISDEESRIHYNVQYTCDSLEKLEDYRLNAAPALQADHTSKFGGRFEAFREIFRVESCSEY